MSATSASGGAPRPPHRPSRSKRIKLRLGSLTHAVRVLPDTLVIGAQRCGTSSLFRYLVHHPRVLKGLRKEIDFFNRIDQSGVDLDWYRSHFPTALSVAAFGLMTGGRPRVIEGTPNYLYAGGSHARMRELLPDARLIVLLRDPVERAVSQYRLIHSYWPLARDFESLIEAGIACLPHGSIGPGFFEKPPGRAKDLVARGLYAPQLEMLFRHYPRDQVLVVRAEDLFEDSDRVYQEVLAFLGLPPHRLREYPVRNAKPGSPIAEATLARLRGFFRPHNERLYALLDRDFGWKRRPGD